MKKRIIKNISTADLDRAIDRMELVKLTLIGLGAIQFLIAFGLWFRGGVTGPPFGLFVSLILFSAGVIVVTARQAAYVNERNARGAE
ncbi:MAG: hypothetical protein D6722_24260 [Bacteroidetes bacterium]|nr:MAG: hypothetical protein D6722_24260 [Bacteroidota bacterium]